MAEFSWPRFGVDGTVRAACGNNKQEVDIDCQYH